MNKKRIVIVQTIFPHYRSSFFNLLCSDNHHDFIVLTGSEESDIKQVEPINDRIQVSLKNYRIKLLGHSFVFQKHLFSNLKYLQPTDIIFGGPDIHIFSTLIAFLYYSYFTDLRLHWWTHGLSHNTPLIATIQSFFIKKANSVLVYEKKSRQEVVKKLNYSEDNINYVCNSINQNDYGLINLPDWVKRVSDLKCGDKKIRILFSGRLTPEKRLDVLIKSCSVLKNHNIDFQVDIVGGGELIDLYKKSVTVDNQYLFKFHGPLYGQNLIDLFLSADVFVLPGKVGLSIIHALSYGLPVITTNDDIHSPESAILIEGVNSFFFEGRNEDDLAEKIILSSEFMKRNHITKREQIAKTVNDLGYLPNIMAERFVEHFNSIK